MKTVTRGPVTIESIEAGKSEGWMRVRFNQTVKTDYAGGDANSPTGLGLQSIAGDPKSFENTRNCSETVATDVLEKMGLKEGSIVLGVNIARYKHSRPIWDGQTPAADGGYYTTKIVKDTDETEHVVEASVSDAMYEAWKKATGAAITTQAAIQQLPQ